MNSTDLQPVSIVDVILHSADKGRYVQTFVVISRPIRWIYTPAPFNKNLLIGRDGPFAYADWVRQRGSCIDGLTPC